MNELSNVLFSFPQPRTTIQIDTNAMGAAVRWDVCVGFCIPDFLLMLANSTFTKIRILMFFCFLCCIVNVYRYVCFFYNGKNRNFDTCLVFDREY